MSLAFVVQVKNLKSVAGLYKKAINMIIDAINNVDIKIKNFLFLKI